jgi:hypothetical protein
MQIIDHGVFTAYIPELDADDPLNMPGSRDLFCRNETGMDWYRLQAWLEPGAALVEIDPESGAVYGTTGLYGIHDYSTRWPLNRRLLEVRPPSAVLELTPRHFYRDGGFVHIPEVPASIDFRQFYVGLAERKLISIVEALAAIKTSEPPKVLRDILDQIPDPMDRFKAEALVAGAQSIMRDNPLALHVATTLGWTSDDMDDFFRYCAGL